MVPAPAAPLRCAAPDSAAPRIGRPRRATAVRRSGNRFCSLSWWGYKVSPVKQAEFLNQTGRVGRIRFCKIRTTQGRWPPVTGSGVRPMEAEGAARGRFGLTPAAFFSPRSHHGKAQRSGFAVKRRSKGAQRGIPIYGSPESKRTLRRRVAAGKVTRPAGRNLPYLPSRPQAILPRGRRGTIPPVRGKCPEGTKGVGISPRPTKFCFKRASIPKLSEDSCCRGGLWPPAEEYFAPKDEKNALSSPDWDESANRASWCHPSSGGLRVRPFHLLLREGDRTRLRVRW